MVIENGKAILGIELGSTRIKAVLIDEMNHVLASGSHTWENRLENGIWTYALDDIWTGLRNCYAKLNAEVCEKYGVPLRRPGAIGFSAMMHGYMAFDKAGRLLTPFRTWRNSTTGPAAEALTKAFRYPIPQRWSVAHLYQAILNKEAHVKDVAFFTTLAGYVHWQLTGEKALGIGDASGMFPINFETRNYDEDMLAAFDSLTADYDYEWKLKEILPQVCIAGQSAGVLTEQGSKLLDESGALEPGIPFCPPEGDAGTGMTATNSIAKRTGNVSAGTSVFGMVVLEKELKKVHPEIDLVTTPDGKLVAMVHANNGTSDLDAWAGLFREFAEALGAEVEQNQLFEILYGKALEGEADCGGMLSYGYLSGESITQTEEGRPMFVRLPWGRFNLANFMRTHLSAAFAVLRLGMDILLKEEQVALDRVLGHGGLFKTNEVGSKLLAAALHTPVSVMENAGEGGPWGMALLAAYMCRRKPGESLERYLEKNVFSGEQGRCVKPDAKDVEGFELFMERYKKGIAMERMAVENFV